MRFGDFTADEMLEFRDRVNGLVMRYEAGDPEPVKTVRAPASRGGRAATP